MKPPVIFLVVFSLITLNSCFKEDSPVPPYIWTGESYTCPVSVYTHQVFVDLSSGGASTQVPIDSWDLAFESAPGGWRVFVNSGNMIGMSHTGKYSLAETNFPAASLHFTYDRSDGNPDSTAVGNWVSMTDTIIYSGEVYLVGKYNGTGYLPFQKIVFTEISDSTYGFSFASPSASNNFTSVTLARDTSCSYTYFSFAGGAVQVEPNKTNWDLVLTQYMTTLFTSDSIPTPYFVRGVLLNPYRTSAILDTSLVFESVTLADTTGRKFKTDRDIIGYDWKDVKVNTQTNSAEYFVRPNYTYFIKDGEDGIYKLRFTSFYNKLLETGYPAFNYLKLN